MLVARVEYLVALEAMTGAILPTADVLHDGSMRDV